MSADPMPVDRACEDCGAGVTGPKRRYCERCCVGRRRTRAPKYTPTEFIDAQLRRVYGHRPDNNTTAIPGLAELVRSSGWSKTTLQKRARRLGLTRTRDRAWSDEETAILLRHAWMSEERIQTKLRAAGYKRTTAAILLKLRRLDAKAELDTYTAQGLAVCFGVSAPTVTRWIRLGFLAAEWRDGATQKERFAHWVIHEKAIRQFMLRHPMEFDLRRVDQLWFMSVVSGGKICS